MADTSSDLENEVKSWLQIILKVENPSDFSINILGNSEKGDNYMSDILFVTANDIAQSEEYNLVLKCSKRSEALRKNGGIKSLFLNEIFIYEKLLPYYIQFQKEKGVEHPFNSAPKCYGSHISENMEVIVLENLKSSGYELWPRKHPLSRKHIDFITTEYGKFHATSVALKEQQPAEFQSFVDSMEDVFKKTTKPEDMVQFFGNPIDDSYDLLKNELDDDTLLKWNNFKNQIKYTLYDMLESHTGLKVILHGDCWNNNFMFLHNVGEEKIPIKVAFLDWQGPRYQTPILDLSYFLFSCISPEDLRQLDDILLTYYKSFMKQLDQLGVKQPEDLYLYDEFLNDWKKYSRYGILMTSLLMKLVSTNKDEAIDIAEIADSNQDFSNSFRSKISDTETYKRRIRPIVEYAVKHSLI